MSRVRDIAIVTAAVAAGLAGTTVALGGRDADEAFLFEQLHPGRLTDAQVERAVRVAPDPLTGIGEGDSASCRARGRGPLRNPWTCVVRYGARRVTIAVQVAADGTYTGRYAGGGGVRGCCVPTR